ncbi:MAG: tetratricopeptide repeat protein [Treponema sp.]|nr:tetratricopeptide repeat protein [Treponema sp.]MCL2252334.1 tetratricopeptide repeat protein [Treponema sp.]
MSFLGNLKETNVYIPNPLWDAKLNEFASSMHKAIVIIGESGMGKTAFLANWTAKRKEQKNKNEKIIFYSIGSSVEGDCKHCLFRKISQRLMEELRDSYHIPVNEDEVLETVAVKDEITIERDKQKEELQQLFFSVPPNENLLIIIDGIDRLFDAEKKQTEFANNVCAELLNLIPPSPENVRFIFSSLPDDKNMEIFKLFGYEKLFIDVLPVESRKMLINTYFESFNISLLPEQTERLAADKMCENPLALLSILKELSVLGINEKINEQIDYYLAAKDIESLFVLILRRIEASLKDGSLTSKADANLARDILSLIAVSRNGLFETEIINLSGATPLYLTQFVKSMTGHLITINGLICFSSNVMRNAVKKCFMYSSTEEHKYRRCIIVFMEIFEDVSFNRRCDELAFQLFKLKVYNKLYYLLLEVKVFQYLYSKDKFELERYWKKLIEIDGNRYAIKKYSDFKNKINDKELLANIYQSLSKLLKENLIDYAASLKFAFAYHETCESQEENCEKSSEKTADSFNEIGICYLNTSVYRKANDYFRYALEIREELFGKGHLKTAENFNNIGRCFFYYGNYDKAIENYIQAIEILEKHLGKDHLDTAAILINLSGCYLELGEYKKALEYRITALEIRKKVLGMNHPDTAKSYYNTGFCYFKMGDIEKALDCCNKSLEILDKLLGKYHPETARINLSIAVCYLKKGNYKDAIEILDQSLKTIEKFLGKNHPDTASAANYIAACYSSMGDKKKAVEYYYISLTIREKAFSKNHPVTANSYFNLGSCCFETGNRTDAIEYLNKSLEIRERIFGKKNSDTADCYKYLAFCFSDSSKALEYLNTALAIYSSLEGKEKEIEELKQCIERLETK